MLDFYGMGRGDEGDYDGIDDNDDDDMMMKLHGHDD